MVYTNYPNQYGYVTKPVSMGARIVFIGLGALLLLGAGFFGMKQAKLISTGATAQGTIVRFTQSQNRDSSGNVTFSYAPVVQFTAANGQQYTFTSSVSSNYQPTVGVPESVIYDKANPGSAQINSPFDLWFGPGLLAIMGVLFLLIGFFAKTMQTRAMINGVPVTGVPMPGMPPAAPDQTTFVPGAAAAPNPNAIMPNASALFGGSAAPSAPPPPLAPDLVNFVRTSLAQGMDKPTIRQTLVQSGWNAADVDRALQ